MFRMRTGIATLIAIFVSLSAPVKAQTQDFQDCQIQWLVLHWQDSTEYSSLEQGMADKYLLLIAVDEVDETLYMVCADTLSKVFGNPFGQDSISIFSPKMDSFALKFNLEEKLKKYREIIEEHLLLEAEAEALQIEAEAFQAEAEVYEAEVEALQAEAEALQAEAEALQAEAEALQAETEAVQAEVEALKSDTKLLTEIILFLENEVFVAGVKKPCEEGVIKSLGFIEELTREQFENIKLDFHNCQKN